MRQFLYRIEILLVLLGCAFFAQMADADVADQLQGCQNAVADRYPDVPMTAIHVLASDVHKDDSLDVLWLVNLKQAGNCYMKRDGRLSEKEQDFRVFGSDEVVIHPNATCIVRGKACFDRNGANVALTKNYYGANAAKELQQKLGSPAGGNRSLTAQTALDANGGNGNPYLNPNLQRNDNLLWKLEKDGKFFRIVPKVNPQMALDANGGQGSPYLNNHSGKNDNLLWKIEQRGKFYMIFPKVNQSSALDANNGENQPYLNANPDAENVNHLWMLEKQGDFYRILSKNDQ